VVKGGVVPLSNAELVSSGNKKSVGTGITVDPNDFLKVNATVRQTLRSDIELAPRVDVYRLGQRGEVKARNTGE